LIIVAFELALAMGAKSAKEAGTILAPMLIFITIPALLTSVINLEGIESFWFAVPILNLLLAMRELLVNEIDVVHALIWIISSIFYATLSILYASRQFNREDLVITQS
jgi:sodium transport system permease protein